MFTKPLSRLPLMREAVLEPFILAARNVGVPVEKYLRSAQLPTQIAGDVHLTLLEPPSWHFIQSVAYKEGIKNFGLLAAATVPFPDISEVRSLIAGCSNLYELLRRFSRISSLYAASARFRIEEDAGYIRFLQTGRRFLADDRHIQLFQILGMVQLVRQAAGIDWFPLDTYFSFSPTDEIDPAEFLGLGRKHYSQPHPGISIPCHLLSLPVSIPDMPDSKSRGEKTVHSSFPASFSDGLQKIIAPYLGDCAMNKIEAANLLDMSPRSLQRHLAFEHASYSHIHDQARLEKATDMLKQRDIKLIDITLCLGYKNTSSFSRAFRRWTGLSPSEYRRQFSPT